MRTVAILAVLTVVAIAFAGCAGKKNDGKSSSSSSSHSGSLSASGSVSVSASASTTKSSSSSSTGPKANHAPTGSIAATVNGTKANFTLNGTDVDHDVLAWQLAFGDGNSTNGTVLPSMANHTYAKAGNFTAVFTVTDGKSPASYNVTLNITGGSGGGAAPVTFSGSTTASSAACGQVLTDVAGAPAPFDPYPDGTPFEGQEWLKFDVTTAAGHPYTADDSFTSPGAFGAVLDFYDASGAELASHGDGSGHYADTIPAGAAFAVAYPCGPGPYEFSFAST